MSASSSGTTYIKGNRMRTDLQTGNRTQTTIFDLDAQKMYIFESGRKEADVWDMAEFSKQITAAVDVSQLKASNKLSDAGFEEILDNDKGVLAEDLIDVKELTLQPATRVEPPVTREDGAQYLAVAFDPANIVNVGIAQQPQGVVGDQVLGVVDVQVTDPEGVRGAAAGVGGEQLAQPHLAQLLTNLIDRAMHVGPVEAHAAGLDL